MDDTVRSFNRLLRPKTTPTGLPNHWVFGVRHVPLNPPGDLVVAIHPQSRMLLQGGPAQILSASSDTAKSEALAPLLLNAFIKMAAATSADITPFVPWTWATEEPQLAKAIEVELKRRGVKQELCKVAVCSAAEKQVLKEQWSALYQTLTGMASQSSASPGSARPSPAAATPVAAAEQVKGSCSKCKKKDVEVAPCERCDTQYCSRGCLALDRKAHRKVCARNRVHPPMDSPPASRPSFASTNPPALTKSSNSTADAYTYYNTTARGAQTAQALMRALQLDLPAPGARPEPYMRPLSALVYTGQDTPENMQMLFGPNWRESIGQHHTDARLQCLLDPPRGSPSWAINKDLMMSSLQRSPRPAMDAEQQEIARARGLQEAVRRRVGVGRSPTTGDMQAILSTLGPDWTSYLQTYMLAINTMDQGVRV